MKRREVPLPLVLLVTCLVASQQTWACPVHQTCADGQLPETADQQRDSAHGDDLNRTDAAVHPTGADILLSDAGGQLRDSAHGDDLNRTDAAVHPTDADIPLSDAGGQHHEAGQDDDPSRVDTAALLDEGTKTQGPLDEAEDEEISGDYNEIEQMETIEFLQEAKFNGDVDDGQQRQNDSEADQVSANATEARDVIPEPLPLFSDQGRSEVHGSDVLGEALDEEDDGRTSVLESEALFPVTKTHAESETDVAPPYSGDGELAASNFTDDPETSAFFSLPVQPTDSASGDVPTAEVEVEFFTSPESPTTRTLGLDSWDAPGTKARVFSQCRVISCEKRHHLRATATSVGGTMVPSATLLTLRCTAHGPANDTAMITWHVPPRAVFGPNDTLDGEEEHEVIRRINVTEEVKVAQGQRDRVTVSTLRIADVKEGDAGAYTCVTVLTEQCCHSNVTVTIKVYTPPSYAVDFAIVGAVCFAEFLVILYFKTRAGRKRANASGPRTNGFSGSGSNGDYKAVPTTNPSKGHPIEEDVQQQLLS